MVDRRVLIPRPETEVVVEVALAELGLLAVASPAVVDLGTGSGAIALSIAVEHRCAQVWATDVSGDALAVASANLAGTGITASRARLVQGDWWSALPGALKGSIVLAVANPPYVAESELAELPPEVRAWEPVGALVGGPSGTEALAAVIGGASGWLAEQSVLVSEIAPHQVGPARELALKAGFRQVAVHRDLAGRDRVLVARSQGDWRAR
jgi:release factor glutamine methyltransferase